MHKIEFDKVFEFDLSGTFSFGNLSMIQLVEIFKDGRVASHLLEPQLVKWFPVLRHIKGCKGYDHINKLDENIKYDAKNFTLSGGCKFLPSNMIGTGRKFDQEQFLFKTENMNYIICDIVDFPRVRVIFRRGKELAQAYPKGIISKTKRGELFGEFKISA
tara:strand:- start:694 stop:1173 length:480 start_codon:yes stop_codon:yes gene_type:complete